MKKTFATLGMSACVLAVLSSCTSTDGDGYGDWEEATPMSEMSVADGEIPPWLLEDDGSTQIDAGDYTPDVRNQYAIPEPGEGMAEAGGSGSASQNQPELAAAEQDDDITVEMPEEIPGTNAVDPLLPGGAAPVAAVTEYEQVTHTPAKTTIIKKPTVATTTPAKISTTKKQTPAKVAANKPTKKQTNKKVKQQSKPKEPTLVTYKVRPGDNLSEIAKRSNTTVAQIRKDSGITGSVIHPGQIIKVRYTPKGYKPGANPAPKAKTHVVARGESISVIAKRNGVTVNEILAANNIAAKDAAKIRPGKRLTIPVKGSAAKGGKGSNTTASRTHTVARGESLTLIAKRYGVTVQELCKANNLSTKKLDMIHAGQKLTIPGNAKTATKSKTGTKKAATKSSKSSKSKKRR